MHLRQALQCCFQKFKLQQPVCKIIQLLFNCYCPYMHATKMVITVLHSCSYLTMTWGNMHIKKIELAVTLSMINNIQRHAPVHQQKLKMYRTLVLFSQFTTYKSNTISNILETIVQVWAIFTNSCHCSSTIHNTRRTTAFICLVTASSVVTCSSDSWKECLYLLYNRKQS